MFSYNTTMPLPKLQGYTLDDLAQMERKEPDWIIGEWLTRGNTAFIIGEPKRANKSWLILNMLWDISEGKPVWGTKHPRRPRFMVPPRPMRSVYFAQEDTLDNVQDRVQANLKWRKRNSNLIIVPKNWALLLDTHTGKLIIHDLLKDLGSVDLIVFDTFRRVLAGSENDSESVAKIYKYVDELCQRYKCAACFAHHIVKPPRDERIMFDYSDPFIGRGSGDIFGAGDAFITIKPIHQNETEGRVTLFFKTKRSAPPGPMIVDVHYPPTDSADWKAGEHYGECKFVKFTEG